MSTISRPTNSNPYSNYIGHYSNAEEDAEYFANGYKPDHDLYFNNNLKMVTKENLLKGMDAFLEKEWQEKTFRVGIVKESDWQLGYENQTYCYFPGYPKTITHTTLDKYFYERYSSNNSNYLIDFAISEKGGNINLINMEYAGTSSYCDILPDQYVYNWYKLPDHYIVMAAFWSYGDRNDEGVNIPIPKTIFIIVKDEAFEGIEELTN